MAAIGIASAEVVIADDYDSFWLWAGVRPQPILKKAKSIYLLAGEVSDHGGSHLISQRSATPHIGYAKVWAVYRVQSLQWSDQILPEIIARLEKWQAAGNDIAGLQLDFDTGTKHLELYADFLKKIRAQLPSTYKLSITGLLDWSANGDPSALSELGQVIDEAVLQTYQGRHVIPGYESYVAKLDRLKLPFKIGILQGGQWQAPQALLRNPNFEGYVVFLINPP